jgi:hypothetical protein
MEAHLHAPENQTLSADIKTAFWRVRQNSVYRLLRSCGLGQHMAALISRQMCDVVPGMQGRRLLMGHPLAPVMLALWIATVARKELRFLHLIGATVTWYADNVSVSWTNRWVGGKTLGKALNQSGVKWHTTKGGRDPTPEGEGRPIPEGGTIPHPGTATPVPQEGIRIPQGGTVEITPSFLMEVFAPTPIKWKRVGQAKRAWTSWRGRELGLVRIGGTKRARAQQHRKREGRKWAVRTYINARRLLSHHSQLVRQEARRMVQVAIGTLSWYNQASPLLRSSLTVKRDHAAHRMGATLKARSSGPSQGA